MVTEKKPTSASIELDMAEHQIALLCRNAVNRLIMLLSVLGNNPKTLQIG